jgi:hypothetical protein
VKPDPVTGERPGVKYISFYWTHEEFAEFAESHFDKTFNDLRHKVNVCGDRCMFYDLDLPMNVTGKIEVSYVSVRIPQFVRKVLNAWARKVIAKREDENEWVELNISPERAARWLRLYGEAKGIGKVRFTSPESRTFFAECIRKDVRNPRDVDSLRSNMQRLVIIARNRTSRFWERREVKISKDWDGFFFVVPGLHGGIVNHARGEETPRWSTHT